MKLTKLIATLFCGALLWACADAPTVPQIEPQFDYPQTHPCEYVGATNDWLCHSADQSMKKRNERYIDYGERCIQEGPDQWGHYIVNCPDPK